MLLSILMITADASRSEIEPTSLIRLFQSGTIAVENVSKHIEQYQNFGCKQIGVFDVAPQRVNVFCLDMLVAE